MSEGPTAEACCASCCGPIRPKRATGPRATYCSPSCRARASYARRAPSVRASARAARIAAPERLARICLACDGPIAAERTLHAKYCSPVCLKRATHNSLSRTCSDPECFRPVRARNVCNMHYRRLARADGTERPDPWSERRKSNWHKRRALKAGADGAVTVDRLSVFERDGWTCGLCDLPVDPDLSWPDPLSVSLDHIVPLSLGGDHSPANVQCSHLGCNVTKGNRVAA